MFQYPAYIVKLLLLLLFLNVSTSSILSLNYYYYYFLVEWIKFNLQKKIPCVFVDVSERVVLLLRHKIDVKEDITL